MLKSTMLAAAIALAGATFAVSTAAVAGEYEVYSAYQDEPRWLPPAPYPYLDAPPMIYVPNLYLDGPGVEGHVEWCIARYRSYNPATNLFLGYDGAYHPCRGPNA